jgi:RNA polymerase sigma-70 factor (ECF subfamily)
VVAESEYSVAATRGTGADFDPLTLAALRARAGDSHAAAEFVRGSQSDVWRLCAHLGSARDADDLTQETYARAFASLHRFAARSTARTWLLAIARRVCADLIRARRPEYAVAAPPEEVSPSADPAESVEVRLLLADLDAPFREAFVLTQVLGLTYPEAADVLGCPVGTIRSRVARARGALVRAANAPFRDVSGRIGGTA